MLYLTDLKVELTRTASSKGALLSMMCEVCLVEVPMDMWHHHQRTVAHKRKAAVLRSDGLKVFTHYCISNCIFSSVYINIYRWLKAALRNESKH